MGTSVKLTAQTNSTQNSASNSPLPSPVKPSSLKPQHHEFKEGEPHLTKKKDDLMNKSIFCLVSINLEL